MNVLRSGNGNLNGYGKYIIKPGMTLPAPSIVIFDMDGTTVRHLNPFVLWLCENYDDLTFKISRFFSWLFHRGGRGPIIPDVDLDRDNRARHKLLVHRALHKLRRNTVDKIVEPYPGIYGVLNLLEAHNVPMALVSNGLGKGYGHEVLETFELARYYKTCVFREDISKSKPHPEPILLALRNMDIKLKPEDVIWYIGDRHKDVTAALAAQEHLPCRIVPIAMAMNAAVAAIEKGLPAENIIMSYRDMAERLGPLLKDKNPSAPEAAHKPRTLAARGQ